MKKLKTKTEMRRRNGPVVNSVENDFCYVRYNAKFNKSQIPLRYLVADRFEAGSKMVADLQRAEIWPII